MSATSQQLLYNPEPMQAIYHSAPADEVFYGGAAGGGKSYAMLNEFIRDCLAHPGALDVIFRRTSPELQTEFRDKSHDLLYGKGLAKYNHNDDRWVFTNGSVLRFSHLQHGGDVNKHYGVGYSRIGFDESTHFMPEQIDRLRSRNRSAVPGMWSRMFYASNPGKVGHVYFKSYFVEPRDEFNTIIGEADLIAYYDFKAGRWRKFKAGTRGQPMPFVVWRPDLTEAQIEQNQSRARDGVPLITALSRVFIPARLSDNPYLYKDPKYNATLAALPEAERRALLYGDWDIYEGQFFPEFNTPTHVIDPILPPAHWRKWRSIDWGYASPLCVLWHAQDTETSKIITYRELYVTETKDTEVCRLINSMTPADEHIDLTVADPQSFWRGESRDDSLNLAEVYARNGVFLERANNARIDGWRRMRDLMAVDLASGQPRWQCTSTCRNLIRTLPGLVRDDKNPEDCDTDGEDHAADSLRYGLMRTMTLGVTNYATVTAQPFRF